MVLRLSESQICFLVQFWREWLIFLILWGLIGKVFVFLILFSLIGFLSISTLALTIRWLLPISTLVTTSQFRTIFRSEDSMKLIWFLVTPPGASHVQYLFSALKKSEFVTTRLFSSVKSSSLSPLLFLLPVPKGPVHFILSFMFLTPILALKSPITMWWLQVFLSMAFSSSS